MADLTQDQSPFNEEFCTHLEYHLCRTFRNSDQQDITWLWCDGISWTPDTADTRSKKIVSTERLIVTKAWIGTNGQGEYKMAIHLGERSLRHYLNDESLLSCIPSEQNMDWIDIDAERKTIELWLD